MSFIVLTRATRLARLATPELRSGTGHSAPGSLWARFDRFLIVGSERGTYFTRAAKLPTVEMDVVRESITHDGPRAVRRIVEVAAGGAARSNGPALFALAASTTVGNAATREMALEAAPEVVRSVDEWALFDEYQDQLSAVHRHMLEVRAPPSVHRGWGRSRPRREIGV
jgi:hypothetical protein